MTGPTDAVRREVIDRDSPYGWAQCQWCGDAIRFPDYSLQHRRARGMDGSVAWDTNLSGNLVLVCGSATTGCHGFIEAHPDAAKRIGFRIDQGTDPLTVPILCFSHGRVYLDHAGRTRPEKEVTHGPHTNDQARVLD